MSTMVGYKCRRCDVSASHLINRGHAELRAIFKVWPHINNLMRAVSHLPAEAQGVIDLQIGPAGTTSEIVEFLHDHYYHDVCLLDEYGHEENI